MYTVAIFLVFREEGGRIINCSPNDLVECGTPIDGEGNDLEYVGWRYADEG